MVLEPGRVECAWASSIVHLLGQEYSCPLKFAAPFIHVRKEDSLSHSPPSELEDFLDAFRQKENGMKWDMPGKA